MTHYAKRTGLVASLATAFLLVMGTLAAAADKPFSVSVEDAKAKVGETGKIVVTVKAAEGWRINYRYAHRLDNLAAAGGADVAQKSVGASKVSGTSISFIVSVKATEAGVHKVTGDILFGIGKGDKKLTEKVPLQATLTGEKSGT